MKKYVIAPMQWAKLDDLKDVSPLDQTDFECMNDIRSVLAAHGKLDRFALHLMHKHFDLEEDEILVEYSSHDHREQFFKVEKINAEILAHSIPTTWSLENLEPTVNCVCAYRIGQGHLGRHETQ